MFLVTRYNQIIKANQASFNGEHVMISSEAIKQFVCPHCGGTRLDVEIQMFEIGENVKISPNETSWDKKNRVSRRISCFFCPECEFVVTDEHDEFITRPEDLAKWISSHQTTNQSLRVFLGRDINATDCPLGLEGFGIRKEFLIESDAWKSCSKVSRLFAANNMTEIIINPGDDHYDELKQWLHADTSDQEI